MTSTETNTAPAPSSTSTSAISVSSKAEHAFQQLKQVLEKLREQKYADVTEIVHEQDKYEPLWIRLHLTRDLEESTVYRHTVIPSGTMVHLRPNGMQSDKLGVQTEAEDLDDLNPECMDNIWQELCDAINRYEDETRCGSPPLP
jgi:hypothetical protein